jgi:hypothetical protein
VLLEHTHLALRYRHYVIAFEREASCAQRVMLVVTAGLDCLVLLCLRARYASSHVGAHAKSCADEAVPPIDTAHARRGALERRPLDAFGIDIGW